MSIYGISARAVGLRPFTAPIFRGSPNTRLSYGFLQRREGELQEFGKQLLALRSIVSQLLDASKTKRQHGSSLSVTGAEATSRFPLAFNGSTNARLSSVGEVNTTTTSFGPVQPTIQGNSTSTVTVGGVYDGSLGDDTLTFRVKKPGDVGKHIVQIEVLDSQGQKLEQFHLDNKQPPGYPVQLSNGLTVAFTSGTLERGDTFIVDVFGSAGTAVDPNKPFNAAPGFDPGFVVTAGSFQINGVTISVAEDDTIQTVLDRVTASSAGVIAAYDPSTDMVTLTQKSPGSAGQIELGPDDSGFLAAVKLEGAVVTPGTDDELTAALSQVGVFSSVAQGTLLVNGTQISVNPLTDSLQDVLSRIESQVPGVEASFDPATNKVSLSSSTGGQIVLAHDSSGLLNALGIGEGTFGGSTTHRKSVERFVDEKLLRTQLHELSRIFTRIQSSYFGGVAAQLQKDVMSALETTARKALKEAGGRPADQGVVRTGLGLAFSLPDGTALGLDYSMLDKSVHKHTGELADFLRGDQGKEDSGFLHKLDEALQGTQQDLVRHLDPVLDTGLILDLRG